MAIRMTHPKHGVTYAVGAEVQWNEKNGWKVEPKVRKPEPEPERKTLTLRKSRG